MPCRRERGLPRVSLRLTPQPGPSVTLRWPARGILRASALAVQEAEAQQVPEHLGGDGGPQAQAGALDVVPAHRQLLHAQAPAVRQVEDLNVERPAAQRLFA